MDVVALQVRTSGTTPLLALPPSSRAIDVLVSAVHPSVNQGRRSCSLDRRGPRQVTDTTALLTRGHSMKRLTFLHYAAVSATCLMLSGILLPLAYGASSSPTAARPAVTTPGNAHAAGATEDSLQACLARIPKDSTTGQRLIAEQSCRRDEGDRKPFQATLGR